MMGETESFPGPLPRRKPAVWLAVAACAGIVLARILSPDQFCLALVGAIALVGLGGLVVGAIKSHRAGWLSAGVLLLSCAGFFVHAGWRWQERPDDLGRLLPDGADLVILEGVVREGLPWADSEPSDGADAVRESSAEGVPAVFHQPELPARVALVDLRWDAGVERAVSGLVRLALPAQLHGPDGEEELGEGTQSTKKEEVGEGAHPPKEEEVGGDAHPPKEEEVGEGTHPPKLRAGDRVRVTGRLMTLSGPGNPGEPDFRRRWELMGVRGTVRVKHPSHIVTLGTTGEYPLQRWSENAREWAAGHLAPKMSGDGLAVVRAILLGDRSGLPRSIRDAFLEAGIIHLLVVSGLHIGMLAAAVMLLVRLGGGGMRLGALLAAVAAVAMCIVSGMGVPAVRATCMTLAVALGVMLRRPHDPLNLLAASMIPVLLREPGDLFTPGFQLSYLCVATLVLLVPRKLFQEKEEEEPDAYITPTEAARLNLDALQGLPGRPGVIRSVVAFAWAGLRWLVHWLMLGLYAAAVVTIVTAPVVLAYWQLFSPAGIVLNLPGGLLAAAMLVLGLFLPLMGVVPGLAELLGWLMDLLSGWLVGMVKLTGGSQLWIAAPPVWWVWGFFGLLIGLLLLRPRRMARRLAFGLVLLWCGTLPWLVLPNAGALPDAVHVLDVGQGNCSVLETGGRVMVLDCGSAGRASVGATVVAQFLIQRGHRQVDVLVLSHVDADHINGVAALVARLPVRELWISPAFAAVPQGPAILKWLEANVGRVRVLEAGSTVSFGGAELDVLWPDLAFTEHARHTTTRSNEESLVLRVRLPGLSVLVTGDAGDAATVGMDRDRLESDVLLAPHHGSWFEGLPVLLGRVGPKHVVVSAREEFPREGTLALLGADGRRLWRTWETGAVTFRAGAEPEWFRRE